MSDHRRSLALQLHRVDAHHRVCCICRHRAAHGRDWVCGAGTQWDGKFDELFEYSPDDEKSDAGPVYGGDVFGRWTDAARADEVEVAVWGVGGAWEWEDNWGERVGHLALGVEGEVFDIDKGGKYS